VEQFASGPKRNYYGKGDIIVYRLARTADARARQKGVFGANVTILIHGDAFWPTYTTGDNTSLVATDSMKNFVQRETLAFEGDRLEPYVRFLADKFLATYPHVEGVQVSAVEMPYTPLGNDVAFTPAAGERADARIEIAQHTAIVDLVSGLRGFRLLRLTGSAFHGFIRDHYTTLPDLLDRPLHMWLDLEWTYVDSETAFARDFTAPVRRIVRNVFETFESGSIQQVIYKIATRLLAEVPELAEVRLEAQNRTWDTIAEQGKEMGVYTEPRPPYGCLGLRLAR
jgi:urate oxidase / 2-oxo-4-hydroxy-4-carboxy-5-ureidoimidazoline decarboxylase